MSVEPPSRAACLQGWVLFPFPKDHPLRHLHASAVMSGWAPLRISVMDQVLASYDQCMLSLFGAWQCHTGVH